MKKELLLIMLLSVTVVARSQLYQQIDLVVDDKVPEDKSVVYEASTSIKVLPGFY